MLQRNFDFKLNWVQLTIRKRLLTGTLVPVNISLLTGTLSKVLAGHASGCWLSALGAGVPYNREKNESLNFISSCKFLTLIPNQAAIAH